MGLDPKQIPDSVWSKVDKKDRPSGYQTAAEATSAGTLKLEKDEQKEFYSWLLRHEFSFQWNRTDKPTRGIVGAPDFVIPCYKLGIEFKVGGRKLTREQEDWRAKHEARGGLYHVVRTALEAIRISEKSL